MVVEERGVNGGIVVEIVVVLVVTWIEKSGKLRILPDAIVDK